MNLKKVINMILKRKYLSIIMIAIMVGSSLVAFTYNENVSETTAEDDDPTLWVDFGQGSGPLPIVIEPNQTGEDAIIKNVGNVKFDDYGNVSCINNICTDNISHWEFTVNSLDEREIPKNYMITAYDILILRYISNSGKEVPQGPPSKNAIYTE